MEHLNPLDSALHAAACGPSTWLASRSTADGDRERNVAFDGRHDIGRRRIASWNRRITRLRDSLITGNASTLDA